MPKTRVAIGCQGGGSHTAFTAGVLRRLLREEDVDVRALSGTSGGAICALLAWYGLVQEDRELARERLAAFWIDISSRDPWELLTSRWTLAAYRTVGHFFSPEVTPYSLPAWGQDRLRAALAGAVEFDRIPELVRDGGPRLFVSAVDVLSGEFRVMRDAEVTVDAILASAAVPTLFRAVEIDGRSYWDGLFSQNPPLRDLAWERPDEIWIIQINKRVRAKVPKSLADIRDRRNELAGNLSLEQELHPIETINTLIAQGRLNGSEFKPITVRRIEMQRELDYVSKLDRSPAFIGDMLAYGEERADAFLRGRR
jgi:NTE family protein